jgi:hypothetical protein
MIREAIFDLGRVTAIAGSAVVTLASCHHQALTFLPNIRELTRF